METRIRNKTVDAFIDTFKEVQQLSAKSEFSTIRQGTATNELTKIKAANSSIVEVDKITGMTTFTNINQKIKFRIPANLQISDFRTSTHQLLDALTITLTESGAKSPTVALTLSDYMELRGVKDRKEAKKQVQADMQILSNVKLCWGEKRGKETISSGFINLADSGCVKRNGDIVFTFGNSFFEYILHWPIMPYPAQLLNINSKKFPNCFSLARKITEHKNMNLGKKNENTIAVKTLLEVTALPSYDKVMETDRHLSQRIIEPFERDMDAFNDCFDWHYCHKLGQPLSDEELANLNYSNFIKLLVRIDWKNYPDRTTAKKTTKKRATPKAKIQTQE